MYAIRSYYVPEDAGHFLGSTDIFGKEAYGPPAVESDHDMAGFIGGGA